MELYSILIIITSCIDFSIKIVSILPAAPKQWPNYDLLADNVALLFSLLIAFNSEMSPVGVDVAWQLIWSI